MSLELINTLAQTIAAVGVIASLVFVGVQIRRNTVAIRAQTFHAVTDSFNTVNLTLGATPQTARVARLGFAGLANLNEDERAQFAFGATAVMRVFETIYYQSKVGVVEKKLWETEQKTMASLLSLPGMREWWATNVLENYTIEFRALVDRTIAALPPATRGNMEARHD